MTAQPRVRRVDATTIAVGDDVLFLGPVHRITEIESYDHPWPDLPPAVIACDGLGWGITVFEGTPIEVLAR